jgi:hypothetical protein
LRADSKNFTAEIAEIAEKGNSDLGFPWFYLGAFCVLGGERFRI